MPADPRPNLSATIAPLAAASEPLGVREALRWLSALGYRAAQLSATDPATRPRDLDQSARRDLAATLARHELACSGLDLFIPPAHFTAPEHAARAFDAAVLAIGLAADLGRVPVVLPLEADAPSDLVSALATEASRHGVRLLVPLSGGADADAPAFAAAPPFARLLDCAAALGAGAAPQTLAAGLGSQVGGIRLVDLWRSGMRGPICEPRESRLDALALRIALELGPSGVTPVVDARQWTDVREGIKSSIARWRGLAL